MQACVARQRRHPLVQLGVVLHRAGAERVEALVEMEVLGGESGVVTYELRLGDLGQLRRPFSHDALREQLLDRKLRHVAVRGHEGAAALAGTLEDRERVLAGAGIQLAAHAATFCRTEAATAARRSMSALVRRSVIATSRPSSYSG